MAAAVGNGFMPPMHPFFQKASFKTNGKQPTPTKSADATSTTEETYSPGADSTPYEKGNEDSPTSIPASQSSDVKPDSAPDFHGASGYETEKVDVSIGGDFTVDLNLGRRKRRKLRPSTESQELAHGDGKDWLRQLQEAAVDGPEQATPLASTAVVPSSESPKTGESLSKIITSPRKTPRRKRKDTKTEPQYKDSKTDEAPSPPSASPIVSLAVKATPKKLLKLNTNGKLLSSPTSVSPVPKSKGRGRHKKHDELPKINRIILKYGSDEEQRSRIGMKINELLSKPSLPNQARLPQDNAPPKATHPFFLGKHVQGVDCGAHAGSSDISSKDQASEAEDKPDTSRSVVAWKDIVFKSQKPTFMKTSDAIGAPWPPIELQHLGAEVKETPPSSPLKLHRGVTSESKQHCAQMTTEEDIMHNFSNLLRLQAKWPTRSLRLPRRIVATGQQMAAILDQNTMPTQEELKSSPASHAAISRVRSLLPTSSTAFDQGMAGNGSAWTVQYAPCSANDVLQSKALLLRDWMESLTTSATQKTTLPHRGKTAQATQQQLRKKRRRKVSEELQGFIASSDDESEEDHSSNVKNCVLISGPPGCGKTASVFAVAKELGFEVFEVHPGMRRNAKDIFDKVGDMTQNHLVQGVQNAMVAESESITTDIDSTSQDMASGKQITMNNFFSKNQGGKLRRSPRKASGKEAENAKTPKAQKQSMILLEEVDVLFDEDKGFWIGVMNLISQSKRPIVLTCNDESSIPVDDLPLHATWRYEAPSSDVASEYLVALAANEGHLLDRDCARALYKSKACDLRATISELDFWCQMGIGSQKGGLDWMLDLSSSNEATKMANAPLRVFSKDTYLLGTELALPTHAYDDQCQEELLRYAQEYLEIPVTDWQEARIVLSTPQSSPEHVEPSNRRIDDLQRAAELLDSRSVLDLLADTLTAALSVRIATALAPERTLIQQEDVVRAYFMKSQPRNLTSDDLLSALEPMTTEKPTFPPAVGRQAPSLEGPKSIIATDIAPYVRSIVAFDQRLEQQREAMTGDLLGKRVRKTRAARAALEGGSKANTRREKWFPEKTDYEKVMRTAGSGWPLWVADEAQSVIGSQESPKPSSPESSTRGQDY